MNIKTLDDFFPKRDVIDFILSIPVITCWYSDTNGAHLHILYVGSTYKQYLLGLKWPYKACCILYRPNSIPLNPNRCLSLEMTPIPHMFLSIKYFIFIQKAFSLFVCIVLMGVGCNLWLCIASVLDSRIKLTQVTAWENRLAHEAAFPNPKQFNF